MLFESGSRWRSYLSSPRNTALSARCRSRGRPVILILVDQARLPIPRSAWGIRCEPRQPGPGSHACQPDNFLLTVCPVLACSSLKEALLRYRTLGRTNWQVSEIGYGMWGMAGWTGSDDAESLASLDGSIDLGCNFFDTAWAYGDGHSEELLGKALRANAGKKLYVATKVPPKNRRWPSQPE